jgi:hypothetical protein
MDLRLRIIDENHHELDHIRIYQDGSDGEGTAQIRAMLSKHFEVELSIDKLNRRFRCQCCGWQKDSAISVNVDGKVYCNTCSKTAEFRCDNCGACWNHEKLEELGKAYPDIDNLWKRVLPGGIVPEGECEECGSLLYENKDEDNED